MKKKIVFLIFLILILMAPSISIADDIKNIVILVDELPLGKIEELSLNKASIGLVNLKSRSPYIEEELYLSINTGRKLGIQHIQKLDKQLVYLGDLFTTSSIGSNIENLIIGDKDGKVEFTVENIVYNYQWLRRTTNMLLKKSNLLLISYDFQDDESRFELLGEFIRSYGQNRIFIFPKKVADEDNKLLNSFLVPLIYIDGQKKGILTSKSTNREGFIALEDISYEIKNPNREPSSNLIGENFDIRDEKKPIAGINNIYKEILNLLIIAYFYHGLFYIAQGLLGLYISKTKKCPKNFYYLYGFLAANILTSLILGLFDFHRYIFLYILISLSISFIVMRLVIINKINMARVLSLFTYITIALGICIYPRLIYNSFIGFNNLIYGARYYGLNNGIMGVLIITSLLCLFYINRSITNKWLKVLISLIIFASNFVVLSANIGANTGGFITAIAVFLLIVYNYCISYKSKEVKLLVLLAIGVGIFIMNLLFNNVFGDKAHSLELVYRIKENGIYELTTIVYYKIKELLKLIILPPFSIVILVQVYILKKFNKDLVKTYKLKREVIIVLITSLVGLMLNDTGVFTYIYMIHYLILYIMSHHYEVV